MNEALELLERASLLSDLRMLGMHEDDINVCRYAPIWYLKTCISLYHGINKIESEELEHAT